MPLVSLPCDPLQQVHHFLQVPQLVRPLSHCHYLLTIFYLIHSLSHPYITIDHISFIEFITPSMEVLRESTSLHYRIVIAHFPRSKDRIACSDTNDVTQDSWRNRGSPEISLKGIDKNFPWKMNSRILIQAQLHKKKEEEDYYSISNLNCWLQWRRIYI